MAPSNTSPPEAVPTRCFLTYATLPGRHVPSLAAILPARLAKRQPHIDPDFRNATAMRRRESGGHTKAAIRHGATAEELMEAIWVAAEMRGGGACAHAALTLDTITEGEEKQPG